MWILSFMPDMAFHIIVLVSILGIIATFIFSFIPFISNYAKPIQLVLIVTLAFGIFFEGALSNQKEWELKVAKAELEVAEAKAAAETANVKLAEEIAKKDKQIVVNTAIYKKRLKDLSEKLNKQCVVDNEVIDVLNNAALNNAALNKKEAQIP